MAQLPQFVGVGWAMYAMVGAGLAIIYLFPRLTTTVPSPLVAIVVLTLVSLMSGGALSRVGDMGSLPTALPGFGFPQVPLTLQTLLIVLPVSLTLAMVGLIESLLTATIVDEMTDTSSDKNREAKGQGVANIAAGFFGGMAGCAMIGQSVINVRSGGRTRLSTLAAGVFLLGFILVLSDWLVLIPMGALVAVMFMVAIGTMDWSSLRTLHSVPRGETAVMLLTVGTVVWTHDLAMGVFAGVILSALLFAWKVADVAFMEDVLSGDGRVRTYAVSGNLFFVTVDGFLAHFDFQEDVDAVVLDLSRAHVWDHSAVAAIDKAVLRFRRRDVSIEIVGLNDASASLLSRLALHDRPGVLKAAPGH
jgi:SulP family sulfate permease